MDLDDFFRLDLNLGPVEAHEVRALRAGPRDFAFKAIPGDLQSIKPVLPENDELLEVPLLVLNLGSIGCAGVSFAISEGCSSTPVSTSSTD
jgi:hypothetical protein